MERSIQKPCKGHLLAALLWSAASAALPAVTQAAADRAAPPPASQATRMQNALGKLPLSFIENRGQLDAQVAYYIQSPSQGLYFTKSGHALRLTQAQGDETRAHTIRVDLVGADAQRVESLERAPGVVSYFTGAKRDWKSGIPTHARIGYAQAWPGIDLAYDGDDGKLESIYTVAPHADPAQIRLRYSGVDALTLDADGNLVYATSVGEVKETAPIAWQDIDGQRVPVQTRFALIDEHTVGFEVAAYDADHALVIDPVLVYSGFIGGEGEDGASGIAIDSAGNAYVVGSTVSTEAMGFPTTVGPDLTGNGQSDVFVAKISADGTTLMYAGYIGGSANDSGEGIAVDSWGSAYIAGSAGWGNNFPLTVGPDLTWGGGNAPDGFVAKISADGTHLVYSGYIGGSEDDGATGIAVDAAGNAYVAGVTFTFNVVTPGEQGFDRGFPQVVGPDLSNNGSFDAFVAKVRADGTGFDYVGYIGSGGIDNARGIAVGADGSAYVTGVTTSSAANGFPAVVGPDLTHNGNDQGAYDAFIAKVSPDGSALMYAGYIGGSGNDSGTGVAVDGAGNAYVAGYANSSEATFPVRVGPDLTQNGYEDAFVAKVRADGSSLDYAGYIGGNSHEQALGIAVDSTGQAYVTGYTESSEATFPVSGGPDLTFNGESDAFVARVVADGSALDYAGYIGGEYYDGGDAIAVDALGDVYVAGRATIWGVGGGNDGFPVIAGPDLTANGDVDAFVAKLGDTPPPPDTTPDPFSFRDRLGVPINEMQVSDGEGITGYNAPTSISVANGEYRIINVSDWTSASGTLSPGQAVQLRHVSSPQYSTFKTTTLTVGGVSGTFTSKTVDPPPPDDVPDAFSFRDAFGVPLNTEQLSNGVAVNGINVASPISVTGGEYSVDGGPYTNANGFVSLGQSVRVRHTSSPDYDTERNTTLTIGGVSDTFTTRTYAYDDTPDPFFFTDVINVQASKLQTSNAVTLAGFTVPLTISVTGGEYQIVGSGVWTTAAGTVTSGQQVQVRHKSAKAASTTVTTTLTVGSFSDGFSSTTKAKKGGGRN